MQNNTSNDVNSAGYITGLKCGAFAYLTAPAATTVVSGGTYYPLAGTFTNSPSELFTGVADPAIQYTGDLTQYFKIDWSATIYSNHNSCTVKLGAKKNTTLITSSIMGMFCKTASELFALSGTFIIELAKNDKIQLVLTADTDGDIVTLEYFTTSINEFFH